MEDIFEDQMYLPMRSDEPFYRQTVNISIRDSLVSTQEEGTFLKKAKQSLAGESSQILNAEGSASTPLSLD